MSDLTRREALVLMASAPLWPNDIKFDCEPVSRLTKFEEEANTNGISILGKYWREKRWDIFSRFFELLGKAFPDMNIDKAIEVVKNRMDKEEKDIHYIYIAPKNELGIYYAHFKYISSDMALAEPIV